MGEREGEANGGGGIESGEEERQGDMVTENLIEIKSIFKFKLYLTC